MTKNNGIRGLTAAAFAATALFAAQPAAADTIEINNFWAGGGNVSINFSGADWHNGNIVTGMSETGGSGGFKTYDLSTDPNRQNAFQSFCVDIFHSFSFGVQSEDTLQAASTVISSAAAADLGRLYTNHHADIDSTSSSATSESAFQLAVWEIVNENTGEYSDNPYSLTQGGFQASGDGASLAQLWLSQLSTSSVSTYAANIWTVQSFRADGIGAQDVVTFSSVQTPVPEPETYAMMLVGLGLLGLSARRKNPNLG